MYERAILHLDLDAFFASVEVLRNSSLKGKPVLIGGSSRRGVVASCNYEARAMGIHSAMPMKMARYLCPDAVVIRGDMEAYSKYSALITDIITEQAPVFEKASIDEFYLDLSGMDRYLGCWRWSTELREKIMKESGLPVSLGLSVNKLVSKVGTGEAKPNGALQVPRGYEQEFLAPLPVEKLPSAGTVTCNRLKTMGVRTVKTLRAIPPRLLQREFGPLQGLELWRKARGEDDSPVVPFHDPLSMSTERTLEQDTLEVPCLLSLLRKMCSQLAFSLRDSSRLTSVVTVKIRYADFNTHTRQKRIPYTAQDSILLPLVTELFQQLYQRRQLIRLIGVRFSGLVAGSPQLSLFDDTPEELNLMSAMDKIRRRFGPGAIQWAG